MGLRCPVCPSVLEDELVDRNALVLPSSENPYGLGLTLRGFPDSFPHVAFIDDNFVGLGELEVLSPGVAIVEREFY